MFNCTSLVSPIDSGGICGCFSKRKQKTHPQGNKYGNETYEENTTETYNTEEYGVEENGSYSKHHQYEGK